ncbi:hypothetical protein ACE7GA_18610 [Roseomonas sp. CCTCC AB2023176]|uniref:hypothetical protein n=1 Tax=Roseomonas sp. CCTCC AB2023176 TaxID=3342640 RepID=UPI0035E39521
MAGPSFEAEFVLTDAELAAYARRAAVRTGAAAPRPAAWRETLLGLAITFLGALAVRELGIVHDEGSAWGLGFLILGAYVAGLLAMRGAIARYQRGVAAFALASTDVQRLPRRVRIGAEGVGSAGEAGNALHAWRVFTEAEEADGLLLFWIGHVQGIAVPLRALAGPEEARAVLAFARERIAAARAALGAGHRSHASDGACPGPPLTRPSVP